MVAYAVTATAFLGAAVLPVLPVPRAEAADALCDDTSCTFLSPNRTMACTITVGVSATPDGAFCAWSDGSRAHTVRLLPSGVLEPCINPMADVVERCTWAPPADAPVLGYGQTAVLGPLTCLAEAQAISCTAVPSGRGFAISSAGILPIAATPPPPPPAADAPPPPADVPPPPVDVPPPPPADLPAPPAQ
jgi:hypothetical protein